MVLSQMWYIPPYTLLKQWMGRHVMAETARLRLLYDDVLDVLKELLQPIPVDEAWYKAEYPAVAQYLVRGMTETAKSHFQKHGYFEGRKPFAPGWRGLPEPTPFAQLQSRLRIIPSRGRLIVEIEHNDFLGIVSDLLTAVPVDQTWYRTAYPDVVKELDDGTSAVYHYARQGYFEDRMPFDITVDPEWYVSRYQHVRMALERGDAGVRARSLHARGIYRGMSSEGAMMSVAQARPEDMAAAGRQRPRDDWGRGRRGGGVFVVDFSRDGNSADYRTFGWSAQEESHVWSLRSDCGLRLPALAENTPIILDLDFNIPAGQVGVERPRWCASSSMTA